MRVPIIIASLVLGLVEFYIIRYTKFNQWLFALAILVIAAPIATFVGVHLVALPVFMVFVAISACALEDWLKAYLKTKRLSEEQHSRLKDL